MIYFLAVVAKARLIKAVIKDLRHSQPQFITEHGLSPALCRIVFSPLVHFSAFSTVYVYVPVCRKCNETVRIRWITADYYTRGRCQPDAVRTESIVANSRLLDVRPWQWPEIFHGLNQYFQKYRFKVLAAKERYTHTHTRAIHVIYRRWHTEIDDRVQLSLFLKIEATNTRRLKDKSWNSNIVFIRWIFWTNTYYLYLTIYIELIFIFYKLLRNVHVSRTFFFWTFERNFRSRSFHDLRFHDRSWQVHTFVT